MIYLNILKFSFLRFFAYPYEILAEIVRSLIVMFFLIFFWSVVARSMDQQFTISSIISYFLIASGVKDLVMADYGEFGGVLGELIKSGKISNYLLRPAEAVPSIYAFSLGRVGISVLVSIANIVAGMWINPPTSWIAIVFFLIFLLNAILIGFTFNLMEGVLYFHSPDASGFRNALNHVIQVLSGAMVPIYLFPDAVRMVVQLTPFPALVFGPVNALRINNFSSQVIFDLSVAVMWGILLNFVIYYFWQQSAKKYEATGI
ncbi:MAG: ABC-2 family transporter protein [Patescibacteria group bacterium]|nr:ABC-2 family transporter protein [Patescibacteria group bacterium]